MYLFLAKLTFVYYFSVFDSSYVSKHVIFSEKKLFLLIDHRDSQGQYLVKCMGDQRCQCATILIWHWQAIAGSAIWNILAHRRL